MTTFQTELFATESSGRTFQITIRVALRSSSFPVPHNGDCHEENHPDRNCGRSLSLSGHRNIEWLIMIEGDFQQEFLTSRKCLQVYGDVDRSGTDCRHLTC